MRRDEVHSGQIVQHGFLGKGTVFQVLARREGLIYVYWDATPPEDYNLGVNPSVVLAEDLTLLLISTHRA